MEFNLADLFEAVANEVPTREALVCGESRLRYGELDKRANQIAHYLSELGVGQGDHVGLYLLNGTEYFELLLGCFKIRAVPVNINYRYVKDELKHLFDNANLQVCIFHRCFAPMVQELHCSGHAFRFLIAVEDGGGETLTLPAADYAKARDRRKSSGDFPSRSGQDSYVLYTGGTTGLPKGVLWSHENVFFAALGGGGYFSSEGACKQPEDIVQRINTPAFCSIAMAPLMHGAAQWFGLIQLLAGNKLVLMGSSSFDAEQAWQCVADEGCNLIQIVGDAMAIPLLDALEANPERWDLSRLFALGSGGALLSPSSSEGLLAHFPQLYLTNSYGSSESGQVGAGIGSSAGLGLVKIEPRSDTAVLVLDRYGTRVAAIGEPGILARCGHIPEAYFGDPKATAQAFVMFNQQRWLLTGDVAERGEDDSITIFGRGSSCINSGGEKVFPEEVEIALKSHPAVYDALVMGLEDARWGSKVSAVIQCREEQAMDFEGLLAHCRQHIASYKLPREIHVIDELPRSPSGKPDYGFAKAYASSHGGWTA